MGAIRILTTLAANNNHCYSDLLAQWLVFLTCSREGVFKFLSRPWPFRVMWRHQPCDQSMCHCHFLL